MKAWVVVTGDELIEGRTADTNGSYLSRALGERGFEVERIVVLGDDESTLVEVTHAARQNAAVMVVAGGLGGTADDLTRSALARAFDCPLVEDAAARAQVESFWRRLDREPRALPSPECLVPRGAEVIENGAGLAPGLFIRTGGFSVIALPGVPSEMQHMVQAGALDGLGRGRQQRAEAIVHVVGLAESVAAERLGSLLDRGRKPLVGITAKDGELILRVRVRADELTAAEALVAADLSRIRDCLAGHVYSEAGESLAAVLLNRMREKRLTLAFAESLTGGGLGDLITEIPGSSDVFLADLVCYSNAAKVALLGVPEATIAKHGAVSEACALAMAKGVRERTGADLAVSTTGIAGPGGATDQKPVGLAWVACASAEGVLAEHRIHPGGRSEVKTRCARHGLDLLRRVLDRQFPPS
ncbi:MAG: CinA family nicotinamide mononucleotide deamidase-related protein [Planctomycetes bacterium]|nr:CinA family nicotinamide mononucleotide deamidase-related protein [Planctomycetota bacterium]